MEPIIEIRTLFSGRIKTVCTRYIPQTGDDPVCLDIEVTQDGRLPADHITLHDEKAVKNLLHCLQTYVSQQFPERRERR